MSMTMRERMLAFVRGDDHDRVPFLQYDNIAAPNTEIWAKIGRDNMGLLRWSNAYSLEHPHCPISSEPFMHNGLRGERRTITTPSGQITEERIFEPTYGAPAWKKHFIETPEDYHVFMTYLRDTIVCDDSERVWRDARELGDDGLPHVAVQRTPYQQLWIEWTGLEALSMHLADYPDLLAEVIALMTDLQRRIFQVVCRAIDNGVPIAYVDVPDNVTTPVLGVRNFAAYCLPLYRELATMLDKRSIPVFVHMDGDLKAFWPLITDSGVRGIDSLSPPPDNDTSVAQALAMWPQMRVGINFPSSVHVTSADNIYKETMQILQEGGRSGRLQIQVSENVPPGVWRTSFPAIVSAITDFTHSS